MSDTVASFLTAASRGHLDNHNLRALRDTLEAGSPQPIADERTGETIGHITPRQARDILHAAGEPHRTYAREQYIAHLEAELGIGQEAA